MGTHVGKVILHGAAHLIVDRRRDTLDTAAAGETSVEMLVLTQSFVLLLHKHVALGMRMEEESTRGYFHMLTRPYHSRAAMT